VSPETLALARPWALLLLAALPLALWLLSRERRRAPRLLHPRLALIRQVGPGFAARLAFLPPALVLAAAALVAVALSRPQAREREAEALAVEGIDIVVALDLSTSMRAADFRPQNRLHVAKEVLTGFVGRRRSDRIGLVVFAGDAYTQAPLTLDAGVLRAILAELRTGVLEDGTAIGNALATAVNRLRESEAKGKAVVLVTDGDSNAGQISPLEAAEIARALGIRVFPILVGKGGVVPYPVGQDARGEPVFDYREYPVNPELLREIARRTGGVYANATDRAGLESGLDAVLDDMEKTRLFEPSARRRPVELFPLLLLPAFVLAALGILLAATRWRPFP
jgi:Ca-activated chloride channel family protein